MCKSWSINQTFIKHLKDQQLFIFELYQNNIFDFLNILPVFPDYFEKYLLVQNRSNQPVCYKKKNHQISISKNFL